VADRHGLEAGLLAHRREKTCLYASLSRTK
jgi:hypothetical protein